MTEQGLSRLRIGSIYLFKVRFNKKTAHDLLLIKSICYNEEGYNFLKIEVLATDNPYSWSHDFSYSTRLAISLIRTFRHVPITDLPLYIGYKMTSPKFIKLLKGITDE